MPFLEIILAAYAVLFFITGIWSALAARTMESVIEDLSGFPDHPGWQEKSSRFSNGRLVPSIRSEIPTVTTLRSGKARAAD